MLRDAQLSLLGHEEVACDDSWASLERVTLEHGAWVELARGWLRGHAQLFEQLLQMLEWRADQRKMYEREVDVPRLLASLPAERPRPPIIERMREVLDARYEASFTRTSCALYRDGRDSVAWHGDYVARRMESALVATVSVGEPRRFLLRPAGGGRSIAFSLGWGDLFVMGGTCQRTYQHAIPKVVRALPRIAIMYRPTWVDPTSPSP